MGSVQELCGLQDHLYDMFVAMITRSDARQEMKDKDIHGGQLGFSYHEQIRFQAR
jgi:hypothetical protein